MIYSATFFLEEPTVHLRAHCSILVCKLQGEKLLIRAISRSQSNDCCKYGYVGAAFIESRYSLVWSTPVFERTEDALQSRHSFDRVIYSQLDLTRGILLSCHRQCSTQRFY